MKRTVLILAVFCTVGVSFAQKMPVKHTFKSVVWGDEREISVFLPSTYIEEAVDTYPVLYLFDAQYEPYLWMASGTATYLAEVGKAPHFIVVGIHTKHRPREFTPVPEHQRTREAWEEVPIGEARNLESMVQKEVMPLVEGTYRTNGLKVAVGHSLGGTFVMNAIIESGLFHAGIVISPNTVYDFCYTGRKLAKALQSQIAPKAWLFVTNGNEGEMENDFLRGTLGADSTARVHQSSSFYWKFRLYDGYNHMSTPVRSLVEGLEAFHAFWNLSDSALAAMLADSSVSYAVQLDNFYRERSKWVGFEVFPDVDEWNGLGYFAAFEEKWDAALEVFNLAIEHYPNDANIYDSRGEALENLGRIREAATSYALALQKLEIQRSSVSDEDYAYFKESFEKNLKRSEDKLKEVDGVEN